MRFSVLLTLIIWIGGYGTFVSNIQSLKPTEPAKHTDAIVVLTGGNYRITTGLNLFAKKQAPELFITGVNKTVGKNHILSMYKKDTPPLPKCCITLGHNATTTLENAIEVKEWLSSHKNIKSIRLVTSPYHMPRALLEFKHKLKNTKIIPHTVEIPDKTPKKWSFWQLTFDEYNKTLYRYTYLKLLELGSKH